MADDDGPEDRAPTTTATRKGGFFTVYKKGQGYYTRLGTALGALLLIVVMALFVYQQGFAALSSAFYTAQVASPTATPGEIASVNAANAAGLQHSTQIARIVAATLTGVIVGLGALVAWRVMNAPKNADFLISTDSEMKKVNWPSREELLGSTRIVILFLFVIALILFLIDLGAGGLFYVIGLLKVKPF